MLKLNSPLFENLEAQALADITEQMSRRHFALGEALCREGERGDCLFLIERGFVEAVIEGDPEPEVIARLRAGDIIGEMALLTDEPRAASVFAVVATDALVLERSAFADLISRYPPLLNNMSRFLVHRIKQTSRTLFDRQTRGEVIGLILGKGATGIANTVVLSAMATTPQALRVIDLTGLLEVPSLPLANRDSETAINIADKNIADRALVVIAITVDHDELASITRFANRLLVIGSGDEARTVRGIATANRIVDFGLIGASTPHLLSALDEDHRHLRRLDGPGSKTAMAWMGRHLARTKIGLALGAGGAKGYAHVGVIDALENSGYAIDFIGGSSNGAVVSVLKAMGMNAGEVEAALDRIWSDQAVEHLATRSDDGYSVGIKQVFANIDAIVGDRRLGDLDIPTIVMTADLEGKEAMPLTDWPVAEALRAALAIPGLAPPYRVEHRRLVDGICLVPVPATALREAGADIVISVNVLGRETLKQWPEPVPPLPRYRRKSSGTLDPVVETLMMLQTDAGIRYAGTADVVVTPRFGHSSWRDFHLTKLFRAAGLRAAEEQWAGLYELSWPSA